MKVYIDVLMIINFICDLLLLISVSIILKRNVKIQKIILAALFGMLSTFIVFLNIGNIALIFLKILLGSIIVIIAFKFKNIKYFFNNLLYFFINSILLGGFIYFINLKINKNNFFGNELFLNFGIFVIFVPIIIYIYIRTCLKLKYKYSIRYKIDIYIKNKIVKLNGYYDTGTTIIDPYKKRIIILANKKIFENLKLRFLLVPYNTINGKYLMKCFKPDIVYIDKIGVVKNILIGLVEEEIKIEGIDCLINKKVLEGIYEN